jgi:hypothetical protein
MTEEMRLWTHLTERDELVLKEMLDRIAEARSRHLLAYPPRPEADFIVMLTDEEASRLSTILEKFARFHGYSPGTTVYASEFYDQMADPSVKVTFDGIRVMRDESRG